MQVSSNIHVADDHGKVTTMTMRDPQKENGRLDSYVENEKKIEALKKDKNNEEKNEIEELRKDVEKLKMLMEENNKMEALSSKAPIGAWIMRLKTKVENIISMFSSVFNPFLFQKSVFKKSVHLLVGC